MEREQATSVGAEDDTPPEPIPLEEPRIEEEIANSDEYMQKGLRDEDD